MPLYIEQGECRQEQSFFSQDNVLGTVRGCNSSLCDEWAHHWGGPVNSLLGDPAQRNRAAADDGHEVWCPAAKMQGSDVRLQGVCLRVDEVVFVAPQVCFRIS